MAWVKLDVGFFAHPKAQAVGVNGRAVYLAALCWSASNLTDGYVPTSARRQLAALAGVKESTIGRLCGRLVVAGLFHENGDGWIIHDYLGHQRSRSTVLAEREAERKRQARHRAQDDG